MPTVRKGRIAAQRLREIRSHVAFDYDLRKPLTPAAVRKINKYWKGIQELQKGRENVPYKTRSKAQREAALQFAQTGKGLNELTTAFIPVSNAKNKPTVELVRRKGKKGAKPTYTFYVHETGVTSTGVYFDSKKLVKDPDGHISAVLAPFRKNFKYAAITAGKYEIPKPVSLPRLASAVKALMRRYSEGGSRYRPMQRNGKRKKNHWREWLHGARLYELTNQKPRADFMKAKRAQKKVIRDIRKKARKALAAAKRKKRGY
jgi:hypothetical protein